MEFLGTATFTFHVLIFIMFTAKTMRITTSFSGSFFCFRIQWQFVYEYICKMNINLPLKTLAKLGYLQGKLGDSTASYNMFDYTLGHRI